MAAVPLVIPVRLCKDFNYEASYNACYFFLAEPTHCVNVLTPHLRCRAESSTSTAPTNFFLEVGRRPSRDTLNKNKVANLFFTSLQRN